jgi:hypothetical protein
MQLALLHAGLHAACTVHASLAFRPACKACMQVACSMQDLRTLHEMDFMHASACSNARCMQALHALHAACMQKVLKKWLKNPFKKCLHARALLHAN